MCKCDVNDTCHSVLQLVNGLQRGTTVRRESLALRRFRIKSIILGIRVSLTNVNTLLEEGSTTVCDHPG